MSYPKHTWEHLERVTAEKMNNMEEGIAAADSAASQAQETAEQAQSKAEEAKRAADGKPGGYSDMNDAPVKTSETVITTDTTADSFEIDEKTYYRIADRAMTREELLGALINGKKLIAADNVNDISGYAIDYVMAEVPLIAVWFGGSWELEGTPDFKVLSIGGPIQDLNIESAGTYVSADVETISFRTVDVSEGYENIMLPQFEKDDFPGRALQMDETGKWKAGALIPIQGVTSWREIQRNVKIGRGSTLYPVHTILNVRSKKFGSIPFEVVAHDVDPDPDNANAHTMTLLCLEGLMRKGMYGYMFDAPEKLCILSNGLSAGAYSITFDGETRYFTLRSSIPQNGSVVVDYDYMMDQIKGVKTYSSNGTLIETVPWDELATLGAVDLETLVDSSDKNNIYRSLFGSGNYGQSAIRQWLNGRGTSWYNAQTKFDMPPEYVNDEGFLDDLDEDFVEVLVATEQTVNTNSVFEIGDGMSTGSSYTVTDKIFLPSFTQIFGSGDDPAEDTQWDAFSEQLDPEYYYYARVKYEHAHKGTCRCFWCLRSPDSSYPYSVFGVNVGGNSGNGNATNPRWAVAPACVI